MNNVKEKIDYVVENLMLIGATVNINPIMSGGVFIYIDTHDKTKEKVELICTHRTNYKFMAGKNCVKIDEDYHPGSYIVDIDKFIKDVNSYMNNDEKYVDDPGLLSIEALNWLRSVNYSLKSHEERLMLMKSAKIAYPN